MHDHPHAPDRDRGERGASLVEYALLLALIAVVAIGSVTYFGGANNGGFGKSQSCIDAAYRNQPMPANCG